MKKRVFGWKRFVLDELSKAENVEEFFNVIDENSWDIGYLDGSDKEFVEKYDEEFQGHYNKDEYFEERDITEIVDENERQYYKDKLNQLLDEAEKILNDLSR